MKNCPRCGSTVSDSGMFCLSCGYKYSNEPPISDEHEQNDEDNSSNTYRLKSDLSFGLSVLAIVFSSAGFCIVIMGGPVIGFVGTVLGVVSCIISLILAINAHHVDKSKTLAKVGIWLSLGFLILNIVFGMAGISLCGGKSCRSAACFGCSNKPFYCDGTQFNPFYTK